MLAQRGHQPRGQQRMAAQVTEEIARQAQRLAGEQRTQRLEQRLLAGGGGRSSSPLGSAAVASSRALSALRSILPDVRRGTSATSSKRAGII